MILQQMTQAQNNQKEENMNMIQEMHLRVNLMIAARLSYYTEKIHVNIVTMNVNRHTNKKVRTLKIKCKNLKRKKRVKKKY